MPWSLARSLSFGVNPYATYLDTSGNNHIFMSQLPNMWHSTYVAFLPLSFLEWPIAKLVYFFLNISAATALLMLVRNLYKLTRVEFLIVVLVLFSSGAFRATLLNGQYSLIAGLFLCLYFAKRSYLSGFMLGLAFSKYSFLMPFALMPFANWKQHKPIVLSAVLPVVGFLVVSVVAPVSGWDLLDHLFAPLRVGLQATGLGASDLYSIVKNLNLQVLSVMMLFLGVAVSVLVVSVRFRTPDFQLAAYSLVALSFFPHLIYDYVFLVFLLAFTIKRPSSSENWILLGTVFWHWFVYSLVFAIDPEIATGIAVQIIGLGLNFAALIKLASLAKVKRKA